MSHFRKSSISSGKYFDKQHRFEHWYRDNTVYFITARCRNQFPAFRSERAKAVFWDRFDHYAGEYGYTPFVTSLLDNHYHTVGYLKVGEKLGPMMRHIHGSVAKLVNDLLPTRLTPFWYDSGKQGYFDGCLRSELQGRRTYRYILRQGIRHGLVHNRADYPHTRVNVELEAAIRRSLELCAFMEGIPYKRYVRDGRE